MLRPTDAATSALFEMKKGAAFSVRQDQQNDAQIFVILFLRKMGQMMSHFSFITAKQGDNR